MGKLLVTWFDYSTDTQHQEELEPEKLEWLLQQTHIEVDRIHLN